MGSRIRIQGVLVLTAVFLALAALMGCGWMVFFSDTFKVDEIEIRGNGFLADAEVMTILEPYGLRGKNAWFVHFNEVAESLKENPRISRAAFKRSLPNKVTLSIRETQEFATLVFVNGNRCVISRDGEFIRYIADDAPRVGPMLCGFSEDILLRGDWNYRGFKDEAIAWAGLSSQPAAAGRLQLPRGSDEVVLLRERIRLRDALRLAEATGIDRKPSVSHYRYIGLDANYDLFFCYPDIPPIVIGGFNFDPGVINDLAKIVKTVDAGRFNNYDYIDLHLANFGRGVNRSEFRTYTLCEWSDGKEAVRVAAWEVMGEVERRVAR